ncbi:P-loop containing nucleoside triphosphate hydrolase protein [Pholiota molesta]|nr:P-loop containing nucleoside triphosphate hydrolase protein [Pholiota molesta]
MATTNYLDRAIEIVQKAIDEDTKHNYPEAYKFYQMRWIFHASSQMCEKIVEYLGRAEMLKDHLTTEKRGKSVIGVNGSGGALGQQGNRTGKSYLAKAVATEAKSTFFSVSSSDLVSKWQGDSERLVKNLFQLARESKPAIILIAEDKDGVFGQMNGVGHDDTGVLVLGATNIPWHSTTPSSVEARRRMFEIHDYRVLADRTEGYSGSDISIVVRDALMQPVRKVISATHFKLVDVEGTRKWTPCSPGDPEAQEKTCSTRPTVTESDIKRHEEWTKESGADGA